MSQQQITKEWLLTLSFEQVFSLLNDGRLIEIAGALGAFWTYDYKAAKEGRLGLHVLLKSGLHSDGFFVSKILLEPKNIRRAIAHQMIKRLEKEKASYPDYVIGIPDSATLLGTSITQLLSLLQAAKMEKIDGSIVLKSEIIDGASLLLVEDFCTKGTGFTEAVKEVKLHQPSVRLLPFNLVIINRGGLEQVNIDGIGAFKIIAIVNNRIQDWEPDKCPLCKMGSGVIKPKVNDHNWKLIIISQLP